VDVVPPSTVSAALPQPDNPYQNFFFSTATVPPLLSPSDSFLPPPPGHDPSPRSRRNSPPAGSIYQCRSAATHFFGSTTPRGLPAPSPMRKCVQLPPIVATFLAPLLLLQVRFPFLTALSQLYLPALCFFLPRPRPFFTGFVPILVLQTWSVYGWSPPEFFGPSSPFSGSTSPFEWRVSLGRSCSFFSSDASFHQTPVLFFC